MKATPIIMSAPMIRALIEGRKTQTRWTMKPQPELSRSGAAWHWKNCAWTASLPHCPMGTLELPIDQSPFGKPGDFLWVRETYIEPEFNDDGIIFAAHCSDYEKSEMTGMWRPPIFMPRGRSRITLELADVRIEHLQDISEEDAIAEGVSPLFTEAERKGRPELNLSPMPYSNYLWHGHVGKTITQAQSDSWPHQFSSYKDARGSYSSLWESLHGAGSWGANPWTWALAFRVHQQNIDDFIRGKEATAA